MPERRSISGAPPRLYPVSNCNQASINQSPVTTAIANTNGGQNAGLRKAHSTNNANGRKRRLSSAVIQVFAGATAATPDTTIGNQ